MTQINFDFGHPSADGVTGLAGELVHVVPTGRFKVGKRIAGRLAFRPMRAGAGFGHARGIRGPGRCGCEYFGSGA